MKIAISGANGFIGKSLCKRLKHKYASEIVNIPRKLLYGDPQILASRIEGSDIIINLAGASVLSRWTKKRKKILYNSRIQTTSNLLSAIELLKPKPELFISTSAVGIYSSEGEHTEESTVYADNFLSKICVDWEKEASRASEFGIRTVVFRLGIVLSKRAGMLKNVISLFKTGLGGKIGTGKQYMPYIYIIDLLKAYQFVIENESCYGVYNLVSPEIITNSFFTEVLSKKLKTKTFFNVPTYFLRLFLKEGEQILTKGQRVFPQKLQERGFIFKYKHLEDFL